MTYFNVVTLFSSYLRSVNGFYDRKTATSLIWVRPDYITNSKQMKRVALKAQGALEKYLFVKPFLHLTSSPV